MDQKRHILIVEANEDWQYTLVQALQPDEFDIVIVQTDEEVQRLLDSQQFDLAIIDPIFDTGMEDTDDCHAVQSIRLLLEQTPQMGVIVFSGASAQAKLSAMVDMPSDLPFFNKHAWDRTEFSALVKRILSGEPARNMEPAPVTHYAGMTGPISRTGYTGPLSTGLMPPPVGTRTDRPRVLIIEANPDWQHTLARCMENEGYFWRVAANSQEALERLRLESFHIVLLDLRLDEPDSPLAEGKGWQLLDYLVANCPKTKVIVASGEASRSDVARLFMRYPVKGFIDKDAYDENQLLVMVRDQLAGPSLRVQMLGDFRVWRDGVPVTNFGGDQPETILKILLTRRGEKVAVDELAEYLWPGSAQKPTSVTLGTCINSVRSALEPDIPRPSDSSFIVRSGGTYLFNFLANVEVDVEQLRRRVMEARGRERNGEVGEAIQEYERASAIYLGDFLPDNRFDQWAMQERSTLQSLYTDALNRLADLYAESRQLDKAIEVATRSLQVDAYIENTYRRLMRYHTCNGDKNAAINVYRALVKLFSEFFGEEPEILTQRLYEDIQEDRPVPCVEASAVNGDWRAPGED